MTCQEVISFIFLLVLLNTNMFIYTGGRRKVDKALYIPVTIRTFTICCCYCPASSCTRLVLSYEWNRSDSRASARGTAYSETGASV